LRWLFPFVEDFKPTQEEEKEEATVDTLSQVADSLQFFQVVEPLYLEYRYQRGNSLNCTILQQTEQKSPEAKYCRQCGFPALLLIYLVTAK